MIFHDPKVGKNLLKNLKNLKLHTIIGEPPDLDIKPKKLIVPHENLRSRNINFIIFFYFLCVDRTLNISTNSIRFHVPIKQSAFYVNSDCEKVIVLLKIITL